ncbi:MAG: hypothetical protein CFH40_00153 [Alphaproteobacteria bacterium MarineAlpha10_Bin3]|jgi:phage terminase small subunit|nr:MAG: hypothetical protein CFH40_00153 [Alphaproteobacteria bacterium MarineAlpha10_Bin3]PPR75450.1 MAG: hypothetical protein CFH09_00153 [Alphaproteobacteria bacterium MarineAlpha4_Bin1]
MSALRPRQERFCQYFVLDPNATHAAAHAGYARRTAVKQGSRLLANSRVSTRIIELRRDIARRHCADADQLMAKLEAIYRRASEDHHWGAAGRAVELQARLASMMPQAGMSQAGGRGCPGRKNVDIPPGIPACFTINQRLDVK